MAPRYPSVGRQEHPAEEQQPAGGVHREGAHPLPGPARHAHPPQADLGVSVRILPLGDQKSTILDLLCLIRDR
jgi:hypothetical protein